MNTVGGGGTFISHTRIMGEESGGGGGGGGGAWWRHTYQYLPAALPHAWSLATVWLWKPCTAWWSLAVLCSPNPATAAPSDLRQSYTPHTVSSKQTISLTISDNCVTCSSVMQATLNRCSSIRPETVTHITCSAPKQPTSLNASGSSVANLWQYHAGYTQHLQLYQLTNLRALLHILGTYCGSTSLW